MKVRQSTPADIDAIMQIYDHARSFMRSYGNTCQWVNGYPSRDIILNDIRAGNSYLIEHNGSAAGVFTFISGNDPTYSEIEGEWLNDNPYGTIHRIAAAAGAKGIADVALDFCKRKNMDICIDTHEDNIPMLAWINKRGFKHCGIIHISDGTPRMAFQLLNG